jgi:hypothetical protein
VFPVSVDRGQGGTHHVVPLLPGRALGSRRIQGVEGRLGFGAVVGCATPHCPTASTPPGPNLRGGGDSDAHSHPCPTPADFVVCECVSCVQTGNARGKPEGNSVHNGRHGGFPRWQPNRLALPPLQPEGVASLIKCVACVLCVHHPSPPHHHPQHYPHQFTPPPAASVRASFPLPPPLPPPPPLLPGWPSLPPPCRSFPVLPANCIPGGQWCCGPCGCRLACLWLICLAVLGGGSAALCFRCLSLCYLLPPLLLLLRVC